MIDDYYRPQANTPTKLGHACLTSFRVTAAHDYRSLVDSRCRDFIHCETAASLYRIALGPSLMNGGPSPRIRALANHDWLTLRSLAASFGVSSTMVGVDDLSAIARPE